MPFDIVKDIIFVYPQTINMSKHINALFYFFQTMDDKLAVVLQAKTGAMRDVSYGHEQADLSTGEEIFILDLNGTDVAQNVFATLICADILNINCALIDETKSGKDIKESAAVYLEQIQKYLENNINKYEYVQSVLKTDDFVDYSGELDWFVYLEKLLQSLEKQKTQVELLLKESANKEREFEQE